jgi:uncharacterized protein YcaQ
MPNRHTIPPVKLSTIQARTIWMHAQRLSTRNPFGKGPKAVCAAIEQLGYVQIDTINVIERCHHHILFNRIPAYSCDDLTDAQSVSKSVFEYWTHALSYVPVRDYQFFVATMKQHRTEPVGWFATVAPDELRAIVQRVSMEGALSIADIKDDKLQTKKHLWGSRKPSKRALQAGFYSGHFVISQRHGMLKSYDLTKRHFDWKTVPKAATPNQTNQYLLDRALRAQAIISLDSVCHLQPKHKPAVSSLIEKRVRSKQLVPVIVNGAERIQYWASPETLEESKPTPSLTHILSPFDPLIIQRKRTQQFFDYAHLFEAYVPKAKRKIGYFTLPVLVGNEIVAALDLKTDRQAKTMLIQSWHWVGIGNSADHKSHIEDALDKFERFQLGRMAA